MTAKNQTNSAYSASTHDSASSAAPVGHGGPTQGHQASLRSKVVLSLAAMFAIFLVVAEVVRHSVIQPIFADLEYAEAVRDSNRVHAAIKVESEHLSAIAEQSALRFDPSELTSSKPISTWPIVDVECAAIVSRSGSWKWLHREEVTSGNKALEAQNFQAITDHISRSTEGPIVGLTCAQHQKVFAYAAAPIGKKADAEQPIANAEQRFLVIAKVIDNDAIHELRERTQVYFSMQVYREKKEKHPLQVWEADDSTLVVETPLVSSNDEAIANLFIQVPRDIVQQSRQSIAVARHVFVCGAAASLLLLLLEIQRIVIGPLSRIREHTEKIAEQGLDAESLVISGNDEIGALARAFDHMKNRLSRTQQSLATASHAAGMSQVADTVIHNVGNVLTNVNSLIETAADRVDGLRVKPLEKLASRLRDDNDDPALRAATPDYLHTYALALEQDQADLVELLSTLNDNVQHIHSVIRDQRQHASKKAHKRRFSAVDLIDEAIGCCQAKLDEENVVVDFASDKDCTIESDRTLLLQVVINLIGNARHAMNERDDAKLEISLHDTGENVEIHFVDRGCGMSEELLERIFDAHFTTRETGSGLGLHFCANTVKRLGGSISAASEGVGCGSTFTLQLPLAQLVTNQSAIVPPIPIPVASNSSKALS